MRKATVVIPAFNEQERIIDTIKAVKNLPEVERIIVINDCSTDKTSSRARTAEVEVVDLPVNMGKGGAMNAALPHIADAEVVAFIDADLGRAAAEAAKIIRPVLAGNVDLCIASFPPPLKKGGFGLVKGTAARAIRKAGGQAVVSPLSGQRAMTREVLQAVTPFRQGYGVELGMTLRALARGFNIMEIPTVMTHNESGRNLRGFIHRGRQLLDVVRVIWQETGGK